MSERHCEVLNRIVHVLNVSPDEFENWGCQSANECGEHSCLWCPNVQLEIARMENQGFECGAMMELAMLTQRKPTRHDFIQHMISAGAYKDYAPRKVGFFKMMFHRRKERHP